MKKKLFFTIIIPAHNEEEYISKTLNHLQNMKYPKSLYETIVVENGSTDKTYKTAKKFKSNNTKIFTLGNAGVSIARNFGASKASRKSDWFIFLDADTILKREFLKELNSFIQANKNNSLVVGTTKVNPIKKSLKSRFWFGYYNIIHRLFKASYSIQIINSRSFGKVKYDERLRFYEDLKIIKELLRHGNFFFLNTSQVETSTRRFEEEGYVKLFFKWGYEVLMPEKAKIKKSENLKGYKVIR